MPPCRKWGDFSSLTDCATCRCHDPCAFITSRRRIGTRAKTCIEKTPIDYRGLLEKLIRDQLKKDYGLGPWKRSNECNHYVSHLFRKGKSGPREARRKRIWLDNLSTVQVESKKGGDKFRITLRIWNFVCKYLSSITILRCMFG